MEKKSVPILGKTQPDLLVPPHILGDLFRLITGEWQPHSLQQKQLISHLAICEYCRTALIVLLSVEQENESLSNSPKALVQDILTPFVTIHHEIAALEDEQIGAYAEAIVAIGLQKANDLFPQLAKHISRCENCKSAVKEILIFLTGSRATS